MARSNHTADQLDAIAADLLKASKAVSQFGSSLRQSEVPAVLLHGSSVKAAIVRVQDWVSDAGGDIESQIRAYLAGVQSKAELHKQQTEQQKKRAAAKKKPATRKA